MNVVVGEVARPYARGVTPVFLRSQRLSSAIWQRRIGRPSIVAAILRGEVFARGT